MKKKPETNLTADVTKEDQNTQKVRMNIFFNRTTQDNVHIFWGQFPLLFNTCRIKMEKLRFFCGENFVCFDLLIQ